MNLPGRPIPAPNNLYIHKKKIRNALGEIVQEDSMEEPCRSSPSHHDEDSGPAMEVPQHKGCFCCPPAKWGSSGVCPVTAWCLSTSSQYGKTSDKPGS